MIVVLSFYIQFLIYIGTHHVFFLVYMKSFWREREREGGGGGREGDKLRENAVCLGKDIS